MSERVDETAESWASAALWTILAVTGLRLLLLTAEAPPLHFDEAQYWTYGETLAGGYYSKPPMTAWLIRAATEVFGDRIAAVRLFSPLLHGLIAWLVFAAARRLFDARTGYWSALLYLLLPGVSFSAALMTTDPPMMAGWALALYALIRAIAPSAEDDGSRAASGGGRLGWWALMGAAVGFGILSKYTVIAFVGGALGYALFSRDGRWGYRRTSVAGPILAVSVALVVASPNLWWNYQNDFASFRHVGDNAKLGGGLAFDLGQALEFIGVQGVIFGPALLIALIWLWVSGLWRIEWPYRLLLWLSLPLIFAMTAMAFLTRAHPNWAAPAYIAGVIAATAFLLDKERRAWLIASAGFGAAAALALTLGALVYENRAEDLQRRYDIAKKTRPQAPVCRRALALEPQATLLSMDRRLLAVCLFEAGRSLEAGGRMWAKPDAPPGNHYALAAPLREGDEGPFLLVLLWPAEALTPYLGAFEQAEMLESGELRTHRDRLEPYVIARVSGFKGYSAVSE